MKRANGVITIQGFQLISSELGSDRRAESALRTTIPYLLLLGPTLPTVRVSLRAVKWNVIVV